MVLIIVILVILPMKVRYLENIGERSDTDFVDHTEMGA